MVFKNKIAPFFSTTSILSGALLLLFSTLLRIVLIFKEFHSIESLFSVFIIIVKGLFADFCPAFFIIALTQLVILFIPQKIKKSFIGIKVKKIIIFFFIFFMLFVSIAEYAFWNEFVSRFNFIAVDYLVYTNEVLKNILESYPMAWIISGMIALSFAIFKGVQQIKLPKQFFKVAFLHKLVFTLFLLLFSFSYYFFYSSLLDHEQMDNLSKELESNGIYRFVEAFNSNEIDYLAFYKILPDEFVKKKIEQEFKEHAHYAQVVRSKNNIFKETKHDGPEKRYNVIYVLIESLGGKYIGSLGNKEHLTPNLDKISEESIFLTRLFSTGTRTVRGIEATVLSVPPTPGYSIVKRPHNEKLNSMGTIFYEKGYDLKFLYGGSGFFDNMSYFFSNNHFNIIDKASFSKEEIHFENAWGACDEDLFAKSIREADQSYLNHKPFLQFLLTTSNHRPFSYPDGKIDILSKTGRNGAVKYTDFAIGSFIEAAKKKSWFENTIFVFVADHSTEGRGKFDLSMNDFHIPAWFYAPKILKPQKISTVVGQIDLLPTLLGLLNFSYENHFIGNDIFDPSFETDVYIGNYQHVGFYEDGYLVTLGPKRTMKNYSYDPVSMVQIPTNVENIELSDEAIAFYQFASKLWKSGDMKEFLPASNKNK